MQKAMSSKWVKYQFWGELFLYQSPVYQICSKKHYLLWFCPKNHHHVCHICKSEFCRLTFEMWLFKGNVAVLWPSIFVHPPARFLPVLLLQTKSIFNCVALLILDVSMDSFFVQFFFFLIIRHGVVSQQQRSCYLLQHHPGRSLYLSVWGVKL